MNYDLIPYQDIRSMAEEIAASKLFGMTTPAQVTALMLIAQANGQHPAAAARDYDIIDGKKPSKKAEAMLRDFQAAGGSVQWHQLDDSAADATFSHAAGGSVRIVWDMARAKTAELAGKAMYKKYPRQMLRSRCISEGVRTVYPAATGGMKAPEEARDTIEADDDAPPAAPLMPQRRSAAAQTPAADVVDVPFTETPKPTPTPAAPPPKPAAAPAGGTINAGQVKYLQQKIAAIELDDAKVLQLLARHGAAVLDTSLTAEQFDAIKSELLQAA